MRPIDFVLYDGDSEPNTAVHKTAEAMQQPILFVTPVGELEVFGYYFDEDSGQMIVELVDKE
jgi:hypothetical protein